MTHIEANGAIIENKTYTGDTGAFDVHADGRPYHTFRTQTVLADGDNIIFRSCRFENKARPDRGQAIALYLDGDDIICEDCKLYGWQDTLFLAPLPPKEYEKDGFLGPKEHTPRTPRSYHFRNCLICGTVDFIFGGAAAVFENCEFMSMGAGYVFAPCTPQGAEYGFIARNCIFTAAEGVADESVYIARPWREYAQVRLENCRLDRHIHRQGWHDWGKAVHDTVRFEEYGSYGEGAVMSCRPDYIITG